MRRSPPARFSPTRAALRLLEEEAGLIPAELKEIRRQSGEYEEAVKALSDGRVGEGFDRLDALGWVKEAAGERRYELLAADFAAATAEGKSALVVSPTHAEGDRITRAIRHSLADAGLLGRDQRTIQVLENANLTEAERGDAVNFEPGDVLQFHQNAKGFERGQRIDVAATSRLPLEHAKRFQLFHTRPLSLAAGDLVRITHNGRTADDKHRLDNGMMFRVRRFDDAGNIILHNGWKLAKDWGHMEYGYTVTSHASQGKTVDRVQIGQSAASFPASSREQFYVSASRARERVTIYTDNKAALREAISETDGRLTATEFVNGAVMQQADVQRELHQETNREREQLSYER
jgi:ATP-dependent exoDNAse (exonuclease V) alpha subunit